MTDAILTENCVVNANFRVRSLFYVFATRQIANRLSEATGVKNKNAPVRLNIGSRTSQGDIAHRAEQVRAQFGSTNNKPIQAAYNR